MMVTVLLRDGRVAVSDGAGVENIECSFPAHQDKRAAVIRWFGDEKVPFGRIERDSIVAGLVDFEHFGDQSVMKPYLDAHAKAAARLVKK